MDFVSKQQTYEALRKLLIENAATLRDPKLEDLARGMQMEGDRSRSPELYQSFLDALRSDPLEPHTALDAAAQFMEVNAADGAQPQTAELIQTAKETAADPSRGDRTFWNHWVELLASV